MSVRFSLARDARDACSQCSRKSNSCFEKYELWVMRNEKCAAHWKRWRILINVTWTFCLKIKKFYRKRDWEITCEGNIVSDLRRAGCLVFELANVYIIKTCVFVSGDVYTLRVIVRVRTEDLSGRAVLRNAPLDITMVSWGDTQAMAKIARGSDSVPMVFVCEHCTNQTFKQIQDFVRWVHLSNVCQSRRFVLLKRRYISWFLFFFS